MNTNKKFLRLANIILAIFLLTLPSMAQSLKERYLNPPLTSSINDSGFTSWQLGKPFPLERSASLFFHEKPDRRSRKWGLRRMHDSTIDVKGRRVLDKLEDRDLFFGKDKLPDRGSKRFGALSQISPEIIGAPNQDFDGEHISCGEGNVPKMGDIDIVKKAWVQRYVGDLDSPNDKANDMVIDPIYGYIFVTGYTWHPTYGERFLTIKYTLDGDTVWAVGHNIEGIAYAIALDNLGIILPPIFGQIEKPVYYRKGEVRNGTRTNQKKKI